MMEKRQSKQRKWTDEHLEFIRQNVVNTEKDLQKMFNEKFGVNVSVSTIGNLKHYAGVKSGLIGGRFKKGMTSPTKGKKWDEFMPKSSQLRSLQTCFKKGHIPGNHQPVGTERVRADGHVWVKVAEPNKWREKRKIVYEQAFGKIPKGYKLIFLDGNYSNIVPENLTIVTSGVECILNKRHLMSTDAELTKSGILIAELIKAKAKKQKDKKQGE